MNHVMLDLETLGTKPGCVILSIGACVFDPRTGPIDLEHFYTTLNIDEQIQNGHAVDSSTEEWWKNQNQAAWDQATKDPKPVKESLINFTKWWASNRGTYIWSQGSNFDGPLIEALFHSFGLLEPWKFYNTRDTRTVYQMCKIDTKSLRREGTYHNALDDALHQARLIAMAVQKIKLVTN